jgi:hypothetical protein
MARALYIHWPFCLAKCPYCDFNSHVRGGVDAKAWQSALLADMRHEAEVAGGERLESIFFGGGTPSLMPPALVAALLAEAEQLWGFAPGIEITLEANPSSVEAANFAGIAAAGVNRVSLGLQSLDDAALRFLGRLHDAREGLAALATAQAAFGRVSFDLIYALPGQAPAAWETQLRRALMLGSPLSPAQDLPAMSGVAALSLWTMTQRRTCSCSPAKLPPQRACPPMKSAITRGRASRAATILPTGDIRIMPESAPARTGGAAALPPNGTGNRRIFSPRSNAMATACAKNARWGWQNRRQKHC